jgi:hypothetical protein
MVVVVVIPIEDHQLWVVPLHEVRILGAKAPAFAIDEVANPLAVLAGQRAIDVDGDARGSHACPF